MINGANNRANNLNSISMITCRHATSTQLQFRFAFPVAVLVLDARARRRAAKLIEVRENLLGGRRQPVAGRYALRRRFHAILNSVMCVSGVAARECVNSVQEIFDFFLGGLGGAGWSEYVVWFLGEYIDS